MRPYSERTWEVLRHLMRKHAPATSAEIAEAVGLEQRQVVSVIQNCDWFVRSGTASRPGGGMKPALWAAWEE